MTTTKTFLKTFFKSKKVRNFETLYELVRKVEDLGYSHLLTPSY